MKNANNKRTSKIVLGLLLALTLILGCSSVSGQSAAAPDPLGKQPELTVLTHSLQVDTTTAFPDGQSWTDNAYTRMLLNDFNIQVEAAFTASLADYPQRVNLAIASGKIPDYMTTLTYAQYKALVKSGLAMDISTVWDEYASDLTKEVYDSNKDLFDSMVKVDGKMYAIPSSNPTTDFMQVMWVRKDWLDELGLEVPTSLEEVKTVAKAFIDNAMGGEGTVGIGGPSVNGRLYQDLTNTNTPYTFDPIFSSFNSFPGIWVKDSSGNVIYGSLQQETKAALQELASMYKDGLINPGMLTAMTGDEVSNNKCGLFFSTWWFGFVDIANSYNNDNTANWQAYTLPSGVDGTYMAKGGNAALSFTVISKDCEHPEAVIKMLNMFKQGLANYISADDFSVLGGGGTFPMYITFSLANGPALAREACDQIVAGTMTADELKVQYLNYDSYINTTIDNFTACKIQPLDDPNVSAFDFTGDNANLFGWVWSFYTGLKPYADGNFEFVPSLAYVQTPTMEQRWANLSTLEYETFSKIIIGQLPIDEFDSFVQQWKDMGGDTITQEVQAFIND